MQFATVQPVLARTDLPVITDEEAAALARTTVNLFRAWELTDAEARTLLGDMAQRTWARWKTGDIGRIDQCSDLVLREQQQVDIEGSVAVDMIVAGFAVDGIATAAAGQVIVVLTAVDNVVAKSAEDHNADIVVILSEHLRSIDRVDTGIIETGAVDRGCRLVVAITHAVF